MQVRFPGAARDFSPRVNFQRRLFHGVRTPPCAIACIYICAHLNGPLVHVRVRWIMETLEHPVCTVGWLSPGKASRIFHGRNPLGQYSCKKKRGGGLGKLSFSKQRRSYEKAKKKENLPVCVCFVVRKKITYLYAFVLLFFMELAKLAGQSLSGGGQFFFTFDPLTAGVVGAPQMTSQPVSSSFLCSPLPSGTRRTPGLSIP